MSARDTPMSGWHEETRRALARGERIWERRVGVWRKGLRVRSGVMGELEVLGDPGVVKVREKKRVRLRIWVKSREEKEAEKLSVGKVESTPKTGVRKGEKMKTKEETKLPLQVTKKAAVEKPEPETKVKPKNGPPRKKAKHHDGKAY